MFQARGCTPDWCFRYHAGCRIIVYAWVNDTGTKRAHDSGDDAYRVFARMLDRCHPPEDWDTLVQEAIADGDRLNRLLPGADP